MYELTYQYGSSTETGHFHGPTHLPARFVHGNRAFSCTNSLTSPVRPREPGFFMDEPSQVGRILRTCDVSCVHLRREMATQRLAVSQVGRFLRTCDVPCFYLRREMVTQCLQCRRSGGKVSQVCVFSFTCDGKWPPSACSVAGRPNFADLRRSVRSPATHRVFGGQNRAFLHMVRRGVGCRGDFVPLRFTPAPPTVSCVPAGARTCIQRAPPPTLVRGCTSSPAPHTPSLPRNIFVIRLL